MLFKFNVFLTSNPLCLQINVVEFLVLCSTQPRQWNSGREMGPSEPEGRRSGVYLSQ
jgi:hypothetical protein